MRPFLGSLYVGLAGWISVYVFTFHVTWGFGRLFGWSLTIAKGLEDRGPAVCRCGKSPRQKRKVQSGRRGRIACKSNACSSISTWTSKAQWVSESCIFFSWHFLLSQNFHACAERLNLNMCPRCNKQFHTPKKRRLPGAPSSSSWLPITLWNPPPSKTMGEWCRKRVQKQKLSKLLTLAFSSLIHSKHQKSIEKCSWRFLILPGKSAITTAPQVQVNEVKISVSKEPRQRRFTQMPGTWAPECTLLNSATLYNH